MRVFNSHQIELTLEDTPLGKGGQGNVYEIISPSYLRERVVKNLSPP